MDSSGRVQPERADTDTSLRAEREKTDQQLGKRSSTAEDAADRLVEVARERADDVIDTAREREDATQSGTAPSSGDVSAERASEDDVIEEARADADDCLEVERAEQKKAIAMLLALEREETDEHLITERARSDTAVASRDDFLAMVSHDVRGILAGMALSADQLIRMPREGTGGERAHKEGQRIRRLTGRMNRLIGDLLDVVSMESGRVAVVPTPQDASRVLIETMESFQLAAAARTILITAEVPPEPVSAAFDYERVLQVLANLVGNALKFTESGGSVALRVAASGGEVLFTVRDTGCGIGAERLELIFERFAQAGPSDRRGLGLGLYIARSIVEAHGGKIWAESEPREGSALHFTLPS